MARAALINADGLVTNVIVTAPRSPYDPGDDALHPLPADSLVGPGWTYDGTTYTPPPPDDPVADGATPAA